MMSEQSALTYLSRRRDQVLAQVKELRWSLEAEIKTTKDHVYNMPPGAYLEAQRLMGLCNNILAKLEEF
jgi:hypothetical protein